MLSVSVAAMELPLLHPFKIARGEAENIAHTAVIRVNGDGFEGIGEATPVERYGESVASVTAYFGSHPLAAENPYLFEALLHSGVPAAARAGLDLALHDLIGKDLGKPLYALLGLDPAADADDLVHDRDRRPARRCCANWTKPATLRFSRSSSAPARPAEQVETVATIRARYGGAIRIDANEGWDARERDPRFCASSSVTVSNSASSPFRRDIRTSFAPSANARLHPARSR